LLRCALNIRDISRFYKTTILIHPQGVRVDICGYMVFLLAWILKLSAARQTGLAYTDIDFRIFAAIVKSDSTVNGETWVKPLRRTAVAFGTQRVCKYLLPPNFVHNWEESQMWLTSRVL